MIVTTIMALDSEPEKGYYLELYNTYKSYMYAIAYNILSDAELAKDAVQDGFVSLVKSQVHPGNVGDEKTKNTLRIIARNAAYRISNQRKRYYNYHAPLDDDLQIAQSEPVHTVFDAMKLIKDEYAEALMLKYDGGYSAKEIAKMMGISEENVYQRIKRGKEALKKILEQEAKNED